MLSALRSGSSSNASAMPTVSVIVRSAGEPSRRDVFKRALKSIQSQTDAIVDTIVVFNGANIDESIVRWARRQPRTRCVVLDGPDKAGATYLGRTLVRAEFFAFLDDDDELLPGSVAYRAQRMRENTSLDCLATNGIYITENGARPVFEETDLYGQLGLSESLLRAKNWLSSCGGLFRTSTVKSEYFKDLPRHREWTAIAYRLSCDLQCAFDNTETHRIYSTDDSQSKRESYVHAAIDTLEHMLRYAKNPKHAGMLRRRRADAYHAICSYYRLRRDFSRAWRSFWRTTSTPSGWRYLPYSLLLLMRISRPVGQIFPANFFGRTVRNPRKYFSKAFWKMVVPAVLVRGRLRLLYALPSALRRSAGRRTWRAYVFPFPMGKILVPEVYVAWKTFAMCDVEMTSSAAHTDFAIAWNPATSYQPDTQRIDELQRTMRVLNARCTDIRKSTVGRVFGEVFGYRIEVDPLTYEGAILRKSENNGTHDAAILQGPLATREDGYVYQKLVTNCTPEGIAEFRVFIVDCKPVAAYTLYAPLDDRFDYHRERGVVTKITDIFSAEEFENVRRFNERIGLDFGVLDVLRDPSDGKIYIIDCNNTPTGPLPIKTADQLAIVRTVAREFHAAYLQPKITAATAPFAVEEVSTA